MATPEQPPAAKRQFSATHVRNDGLPAMLLGQRDGKCLYRVSWAENGRRHENTLVRDDAIFAANYRSIA